MFNHNGDILTQKSQSPTEKKKRVNSASINTDHVNTHQKLKLRLSYFTKEKTGFS
jgi:hypothetical protein